MTYRTGVRVTLASLALLLVAACVPMGPPAATACPDGDIAAGLVPDSDESLGLIPASATASDDGAWWECLADDSDETYVEVNRATGFVVSFPETGATSWTSGTLYLRMARPSGAAEIDSVTLQTAGKFMVAGAEQTVTTTPADYTFTFTDLPTSASEIQGVRLSVAENLNDGGSGSTPGSDGFRVYRAQLVVT